MIRCLFLMIFTFSVFGSAFCADDEPTTPTQPTVHFRSFMALQFDVWLDGKRVGFSPLERKLEPGTYLFTTGGESMEPVIQELVIGPGGDQIAVIQSLPLTPAVYQRAGMNLIQQLQEHPENPHLLILAIMLSTDPGDARVLMKRAEDQNVRSPFIELVRAKFLAAEGRMDEAFETTRKALAMEPGLAAGWRQRARLELMEGEAGAAKESAHNAVLIEPSNWLNYDLRARIHEQQGNSRAAQNDKERANELRAKYAELVREYIE